MDQIEPEALYDERGDVSRTRPVMQGDVFDGVALCAFDDEPMKVQVVAHPCAMRTGADLTARITVAPVELHRVVAGQRGWNGNLRVMPLAELVGGQHFATKFIDVTAAPAALLTRERRIATLSHRGICVLQQRLVKHYTRVEVGLELLRRESAAILTEAELQWDWLEQVLTEADQTDESAIEAEVAVFDGWLSEGTPSRRKLLRMEIHHTDVRREAQRAARDRAKEQAWERGNQE